MEPHPGIAPGHNGFADRGVLLLARAVTEKRSVHGGSRTHISAFAGPRPVCWTTRTFMKRHPRQDSHLQPSRSKRGALVIELRGCQQIGRRRSCSPDPATGPLGFRDRSGALIRFAVHGNLAPSVGLAPTPFRLTGGRAPLTPRRIRSKGRWSRDRTDLSAASARRSSF